MTDPRPEATARPDEDDGTCRYPDCTRPRKPSDAAPGRPSLYCEQPEPGGPIHNAANAWKERRRRATGARQSDGADDAGRPVSMAKLTLEDRLAQLPGQIDGLVIVLQQISENINVTRDREAVAAEVDQVHADALARTAEADRLRGLAERRARQAEQDKDEADAAAAEALAQAQESARAAEAAREQVRAAEAQVVELENARAAEQKAAREALVEARAEVEHIRAAAAADVEAAREEARRVRDEARSDHEALRAQYAEQLEDIQRHADERVAALNQALELARDTAEAYRAQIAAPRPETPESPTGKRTTPRKRAPS